MNNVFHIYGDNIVECTRTIEFIKKGFSLNNIEYSQRIDLNKVTSPKFIFTTQDSIFTFILIPGIHPKRWSKNVYKEFVLDKGGQLKEGVDAIISKITEKSEIILLAMEFSAALPAGNNAWQRSGRAYSLTTANIPYFYIIHLGGKEYISKTKKLTTRLANPAIPLSFTLNSLSKEAPSLIVYEEAPEANDKIREKYRSSIGIDTFCNYLFNIINDKPTQHLIEELTKKNIEFLNERNSTYSYPKLDNDDYIEIYESSEPYMTLHQKVKENKIPWNKRLADKSIFDDPYKVKKNSLSKKASIFELMYFLSTISYNIVSKDSLPLSFVPANNRGILANHIKQLYPNKVNNEFFNWISKPEDLVVCCINGFKPAGDDSRPDRGLTPFAKMLTDLDILTLVYGPGKKEMWDALDKEPQKLKNSNGLWDSILNFSEGILVESKLRPNDDYTYNTYYKNHWSPTLSSDLSISISPEKEKFIYWPKFVGEHDVDTCLHLLFRYFAKYFECVCNPPGGDWSGVSLLDTESNNKNQIEYRWTSMNRVSKTGTKRPDHIYQFNFSGENILLLIESKGLKSAFKKEKNVGPYMFEYLKNLTAREYTATRNTSTQNWEYNPGFININDYTAYNSIAYHFKNSIEKELSEVSNLMEHTGADIIFAIKFNSEKSDLHIITHQYEELANHLQTSLKNDFISINVHLI